MSKLAKKKPTAKPQQSLQAPQAPPMDATIARVMAKRRRSAKTAGKKRA
jgi:hypothetical protein